MKGLPYLSTAVLFLILSSCGRQDDKLPQKGEER
jgi:hypothetical protein